ncbi:MAG TPA: valine--tRNA ligase, partial [Verrucomicrobia bacterium]|nr:valine--tRNA ligase [Verrucomicrobiota bacterium]
IFEKFEIGRNFGTKLWNAARFIQMNSGEDTTITSATGLELDRTLLGADDRHILLRLNAAIENCNANLEKYRFNDAAQVLYEFVWHQYCDWYLEYA